MHNVMFSEGSCETLQLKKGLIPQCMMKIDLRKEHDMYNQLVILGEVVNSIGIS